MGLRTARRIVNQRFLEQNDLCCCRGALWSRVFVIECFEALFARLISITVRASDMITIWNVMMRIMVQSNASKRGTGEMSSAAYVVSPSISRSTNRDES